MLVVKRNPRSRKHVKPEPWDVQGDCVICVNRKQIFNNNSKEYRPYCQPCFRDLYYKRKTDRSAVLRDASIKNNCTRCHKRPQAVTGNGKFRAICQVCHDKRITTNKAIKDGSYIAKTKRKSYRDHKKSYCEECNFVAVHRCQLDVDHIDGDHYNDDPSNLKTLCANCHRLKTQRNKDWIQRSSLAKN